MTTFGHFKGSTAKFLGGHLHELLKHRTTHGAAIGAPPHRTGLVKPHVAARDNIGGKAHKPNIAGIIGGSGLACGRNRQVDHTGGGAALHHAPHHRTQLIGGDWIHHLFAVRGDTGRLPGWQAWRGAIDAVTIIMAIDRAPIAILHPVHQGWLHPLAAIGEHRIGRHHLVQRGFFCTQRVGQEGAHIVVDPKAFSIPRDNRHTDLLCQTNGHQVPAPLDAGAQGRWAIEFIR